MAKAAAWPELINAKVSRLGRSQNPNSRGAAEYDELSCLRPLQDDSLECFAEQG